MNKLFLTSATIAASLAVFAVGVTGAVAGMGGSTASTLTAKYKEADADDPYGMSTFKGTVGPRKCAKARSVAIKGYGKEKTNRKGKFEFELDGPAKPGKYKVKVAAKRRCAAVTKNLRVPRS